jgi:hypothetical protein
MKGNVLALGEIMAKQYNTIKPDHNQRANLNKTLEQSILGQIRGCNLANGITRDVYTSVTRQTLRYAKNNRSGNQHAVFIAPRRFYLVDVMGKVVQVRL